MRFTDPDGTTYRTGVRYYWRGAWRRDRPHRDAPRYRLFVPVDAAPGVMWRSYRLGDADPAKADAAEFAHQFAQSGYVEPLARARGDAPGGPR